MGLSILLSIRSSMWMRAKIFEMSELCNNSGLFLADRMKGSDISVTFALYDKEKLMLEVNK